MQQAFLDEQGFQCILHFGCMIAMAGGNFSLIPLSVPLAIRFITSAARAMRRSLMSIKRGKALNLEGKLHKMCYLAIVLTKRA